MTQVLDQSDIDALLAAAAAGEQSEEPEIVAPDRDQRSPSIVRPYDFKRPERVSKEQIRALEGIHETFARNLGASLSGFLRTIVEIRVATIEQLTYSEFIHSLPNPTNFNLLSAEPLQGQLCLELSPVIIYPIIDRLLGGSSTEVHIPQRPLTLIELRLVRCITDRAVAALTEVWSELIDVRFAIREVESNAQLVQIVAPNEVVIVLGFEIRLGQRAGTMSLCVPYKVIEPVMDKLGAQGWLAYQRQSASESRRVEIGRNIGATTVELRAFLAETTMTMRDLRTLQVGDIIPTDKTTHGDIIIQVNEQNTFAGRIGRHRDRLAIKLVRRAEVEERL